MKILAASAFALAFVVQAVSQSGGTTKNELMVWGGISPDSTTVISAFGRTRNARFGIVSLRYSRRFNNGRIVNLKYTADLTPAALINFRDPSSSSSERRSAYGFGAAPLGIQVNFRPRKRIQPFVGLSGGMLYFNKPVPGGLGSHFQFTADLGAGVEMRLHDGRAVTIGYKYLHVSNGDRGAINPGFDNNLIYLGYTIFSK